MLRVLLSERDRKRVARELGLSPETVKTHLRNAREKCGTSSSFAVAKALAQESEPAPNWGIPPLGVGSEPRPERRPGSSERAGRETRRPNEIREERAAFDFGGGRPRSSTTQRVPDGSRSRTLQRLLLSAALVLALMATIILAFPLSESFQRMADVIHPPTR